MPVIKAVSLLLFVSVAFGSPALDRNHSLKKRTNNLPVIPGDEDVASLEMLKKHKKWHLEPKEVKLIKAFGPESNKAEMAQDSNNKRSFPGGVKSFSEQHSAVSQYSNINGDVLSKSDQKDQAHEDGKLLASFHRADTQQANRGQKPYTQALTELDLPDENVHKKVLNKNGQTFDLDAPATREENAPIGFGAKNGVDSMLPATQDEAIAYNLANEMAANYGGAVFGNDDGFGFDHGPDSYEQRAQSGLGRFEPQREAEPAMTGYDPSDAGMFQKRAQDGKVEIASELSRYILETGDEEGVANYFQQLIHEGELGEYEALDYLNIINSMLSAEKESELEVEREEEREREAQMILDFSDYLDAKYQNGEIPSHLYRGLKRKLMESVIDRAAADPQFLAEPANNRRRR